MGNTRAPQLLQMDAAKPTGIEYRDVFFGRLEAALRAREIAATNDAADFETLARQSTGPSGEERLICDGPVVALSSAKVLGISLIVHELSTNAGKDGPLHPLSMRSI
ncbi:hypothetical protein [Rhizobium tubonense]|uniref:Uncharacterized protein n=1 Tax=Rhizobium tubonense TaxID=484088 RepID=A0A2W4CRJ6_9HYPH|nr:hypothetical protein [Rhizobium tubonense]PZM14921.1 hypothetical protein CPY51_09555 [Rhizobium tubonense]